MALHAPKVGAWISQIPRVTMDKRHKGCSITCVLIFHNYCSQWARAPASGVPKGRAHAVWMVNFVNIMGGETWLRNCEREEKNLVYQVAAALTAKLSGSPARAVITKTTHGVQTPIHSHRVSVMLMWHLGNLIARALARATATVMFCIIALGICLTIVLGTPLTFPQHLDTINYIFQNVWFMLFMCIQIPFFSFPCSPCSPVPISFQSRKSCNVSSCN